MEMRFAIQAKAVVKTYGKGRTRVDALRGIDLDVPAGCVWAIVGPSGSGKTTLLTVLGLVTEPTQGGVILDGTDIYGAKRPDLARIRRETIGFVFQSPNLIPFLTARENVLLPMHLLGNRGARADTRTQELLEYLGVADRALALPAQLSGGEQQRIAVARALANRPKVILADEPTASLDADRARTVMQLLRKVSRENGTTVLVVTHDHRLFDEADRIVEMMDGRIAATENAAQPSASF